MPAPPRLLIVTAAFGEGHNSAARNLKRALDAAGAESRVEDPCLLAIPHTTRTLCSLYRFITNHLPWAWQRIYQSADRWDFSLPGVPFVSRPERCLAQLIADFRPHAVICTFPLYPYFLRRIFRDNGTPVPVFTVITDSSEINSSWLRGPTDHWLVTDPDTRDSLIRKNIPADRIADTGFPVDPVFSQLQPVPEDAPCQPFRVLYFPTRQPALWHQAHTLLETSPAVHLTLVLGKNTRRFLRAALEIKRRHPGRVRLVGWTRRVPQLLNRHHLVIGKAGGATVHEAIAARCPMLIHHLVPGQEEGNLQLLESIGGGRLAESPECLASALDALLADDAAGWRQMKRGLIQHGRHAGALAASSFILQRIPASS
jgi:processive 1,2-diacylglycerol beta-glucosyltransferase